jgi:hypothetical protein
MTETPKTPEQEPAPAPEEEELVQPEQRPLTREQLFPWRDPARQTPEEAELMKRVDAVQDLPLTPAEEWEEEWRNKIDPNQPFMDLDLDHNYGGGDPDYEEEESPAEEPPEKPVEPEE